MVAFQKLRDLVDDTPELIVSKALENETFEGLCYDVFLAANELRNKEHSRRELYASPTNPAFLAAWQDYNSKYSRPVGQVRYVVFRVAMDELFGPTLDKKGREALWKKYEADWRGDEQRFGGSGLGWFWDEAEKSFETRWRRSDDLAHSNANAIELAIEEARISIEFTVGDGLTDEGYQEVVRSGIQAWNSLAKEVGFDLAGVFRRRKLVPFVMIPRHVSNVYGATDSLSLMARLQQAHEAFIYGVPLAAFALMRVILELLLRDHYGAIGKDLFCLIENAKERGLIPSDIRFPQLHLLRTLGNDALHPSPKELQNIGDIEREVISLLMILRTLIERAPENGRIE